MTSNCIYCSSNKIKSLEKRTLLGYHRFYCRVCHKRFNERNHTPFNLLQFPTEYRALDTNGNLVDCRLSDKRDFGAATKFFKSALQMSETPPERATTDGHPSYPRSISEVLGKNVKHRTNQYLNNMIEQDHR